MSFSVSPDILARHRTDEVTDPRHMTRLAKGEPAAAFFRPSSSVGLWCDIRPSPLPATIQPPGQQRQQQHRSGQGEHDQIRRYMYQRAQLLDELLAFTALPVATIAPFHEQRHQAAHLGKFTDEVIALAFLCRQQRLPPASSFGLHRSVRAHYRPLPAAAQRASFRQLSQTSTPRRAQRQTKAGLSRVSRSTTPTPVSG